MGYISIPKDLGTVKSKIAFGLSSRQLVCFGAAAAVGLSSYLITRTRLGNDVSALIMILLVLPFLLFALYEKNGQPLEEIAANILMLRFGFPRNRPYITNNLYKYIQNCVEREGKPIEKNKGKNCKSVAKSRQAL
jgi:hypothetical protein